MSESVVAVPSNGRRSLTESDGTTSRPTPCSSPLSPIDVPDDAGVGVAVARDPGHALVRAARSRAPKLMPQVSLLGSNDSVLNGIAISVIQPRSSIVAAVSQMPSQSPLHLADVLEEPVVAHAVRVRLEAIAAAAVVERVEDHREPVVAEYLFALPQDPRRDWLGSLS